MNILIKGIRNLISALFLIFFIPMIAQVIPETYTNPILPGFHPDPSICVVDDDFYLVNSSFEWYPGIPVYHSKDLVNWQLIGYGINHPDQVNLPEKINDSRGVYAPTIRYHKGTFYIINTCVECGGNFYITAAHPSGPWSNPIWLDNAPGIDPSLFWDDDGRCYYTGNENLSEDDRKWTGQSFIWMQELDLKTGKLVGKREKLTFGHATNARWTEGAHLYKINGKYLLMVAEGGTSFYHATTVFHSEKLWGPYVPDDANPVFTHRHLGKDYPIWAVGHTDMVQTKKGDWWAVLHAKKKVDGYSILARETYLVPVQFDGQTPVFNPGIGILQKKQGRPDLPWASYLKNPSRDDFNQRKLSLEWNFLKTPNEKWYNLDNNKLYIKLRPQTIEKGEQSSLIARRVLNHNFMATTSLKFKTKKINEKAGIVLYRTRDSHYQLVKTAGEIQLLKTTIEGQKIIARESYANDNVSFRIQAKHGNNAIFSYSRNDIDFIQIGASQNLSNLADEVSLRFNGLYMGMYATSTEKSSKEKALFNYFEYK